MGFQANCQIVFAVQGLIGFVHSRIDQVKASSYELQNPPSDQEGRGAYLSVPEFEHVWFPLDGCCERGTVRGQKLIHG